MMVMRKRGHKSVRKAGRQVSFTVTNMRNIHEVCNALTTTQCGYLMRLQCHISYEEGTLINADKTPMNRRDMINELKLTKKRSTFYDFLSACLEHDIIRKENDNYTVNNKYHFKGTFNDKYVIKSYITKIKQIYKEVKASDIGLIYRMLPYVNLKTNTLCENPFESDLVKLKPFNLSELANAIGISSGEIGRRLPKMKFGDEYVIAKVKFNEKKSYMVNPWVFYRDHDDPHPALQHVFDAKSVVKPTKIKYWIFMD